MSKQITDNEIIKALECCCEPKQMGCTHCSVSYECIQGELNIGALVLDLINRLKAEKETFETLANEYKDKVELLEIEKSAMQHRIDKQQAEIEKKSKAVVKAAQEIVDLKIKAKQQQAEIERLQKDKADIISAVEYRINQAKELAYKEFVEKLKQKQQEAYIRHVGYENDVVEVQEIDNLLAELTPPTLNKLPHNSLCETETYEGDLKG